MLPSPKDAGVASVIVGPGSAATCRATCASAELPKRSPCHLPSQGGVAAMALSAAATYAPKNIRVNCVAPGLTRTKLAERITSEAGCTVWLQFAAACVGLESGGAQGQRNGIALASLFPHVNHWSVQCGLRRQAARQRSRPAHPRVTLSCPAYGIHMVSCRQRGGTESQHSHARAAADRRA